MISKAVRYFLASLLLLIGISRLCSSADLVLPFILFSASIVFFTRILRD